MYLAIVIITCLICLILEGFFSGSEIAFVNADKNKLEAESKEGSKSAKIALFIINSPAKLFSATLLGTNVTTITATVVVTLYIIHTYGEPYAPLAIIYWPLTLIFGEIVPKSLYQHFADKIVLKIAPLLIFWSYLIYPLGWLFGKFSAKLLNILPATKHQESGLSREELEAVLEGGVVSGKSDVNLDEKVMITRILSLSDKKVENIMTPLVDVKLVSTNSTREQAEQLLEESGFSRLPVYKGNSYDIIGAINFIDLLFKDTSSSIEQLIESVIYVPEEMPVDELLIKMKKINGKMAVVVDEYGAAVGIVTNEDILEEVVGDIKDEHDKNILHYKRLGSKRYLINGKMEIEEANARLGLEIPEGDYETVAGFIIFNLEVIPKVGDILNHGNWLYTIKKATERSILEIEAVKK